MECRMKSCILNETSSNITAITNNTVVTDAAAVAVGYNNVELVFIYMAMILLSFFTIAGNILVFAAYVKNKALQVATNYFILSLAVADITIGTISVNFYTVYLVVGYWPLGEIVCDMWLCIDYWCCQTSVLNLVVICIDRFLSIRYPVYYRVKRSKYKIKVAIAVIWIVAFLLWVPWIISYQFLQGARTVPQDQCYIQFLYESWYITIITAMAAYYGPILLMGILYLKMYFLLVERKEKVGVISRNQLSVTATMQYTSSIKYDTTNSPINGTAQNSVADQIEGGNGIIQNGNVNGGYICSNLTKDEEISVEERNIKYQTLVPEDNVFVKDNNNEYGNDVKNSKAKVKSSAGETEKSHKKQCVSDHERATRLIIFIILAFAITWLPYDLFALIAPFWPNLISASWWHFGYIFCYVNSLLNPICYAFGNKKFKQTFKSMLFNCKKR